MTPSDQKVRELSPVSSSWVSHLYYGADGSPGTVLGRGGHPGEDIHWVPERACSSVHVWTCGDGPLMGMGGAGMGYLLFRMLHLLLPFCFFFCAQMSFLSHDITVIGSGNVFFATDHQFSSKKY